MGPVHGCDNYRVRLLLLDHAVEVGSVIGWQRVVLVVLKLPVVEVHTCLVDGSKGDQLGNVGVVIENRLEEHY